ncbi:MAG TPA: hypothetical protein VJB97_04810, partial [Candidatus Paceibacterota bacterium]
VEGSYLTVNYAGLTAPLISAVNELNIRVDSILNGTATSTITNVAYQNASTTATDTLCIAGDCRSEWPAVATSTDLSGYATLGELSSAVVAAKAELNASLASATSSLNSQLATTNSNIATHAAQIATLESATSSYALAADLPNFAEFATTAGWTSALDSATSSLAVSFASQLASALSSISTTTVDTSNLVSTSTLASELASYLTFTDLSSELADFGSAFVSSTTLASTLSGYATFADIPSPVTLANLSGTVSGDILPAAHNTYDLGTNENRFANIYAQNIHAGDLTFTETTSAISGETLVAGDSVMLYVNSVGANTATVPINIRTALNSNNWGSNNIYLNTSGSLVLGAASTTVPTGKFDIHSTSQSDLRLLTLTNTGGGSNPGLPYSMYVATSTGDLRIASNDNSQGSLVNTSYGAWTINLGGASDAFSIQRSANTSLAYSNVLSIASTGAITSTSNSASTFPYASSTAITASGTGYFGTASTTNLTVSALTSGRVPFITTAGAFTDSSALTFDSSLSRLTATYASSTASSVSGDAYFAGSGIWNSSGNVGIGGTPTYMLDVYGNAMVGRNEDLTPVDGGTVGQLLIDGNGYGGWIALDATAMRIGENSAIRGLALQTNETDRLFITGAGNVGIGTTTPQSRLHVTNGFSGTVPHSFADLLVEDDSDVAISLLGPSTQQQYIFFGDEADNTVGRIVYDHT